MQDLRSIPGGEAGRLFGAPGGEVGTCAAPGAVPTAASASASRTHMDRRLRSHPQQNLRCPRCDSLNTKFCYYNNYNLSQPRHFCKSCRRYWTKGGVLRNVPVGGGCRKSKRSSSSSSSTSSLSKTSKPASNGCKYQCREPPAASSSSDSSSLTSNAADAVTVTEEPRTPPPPAALDSYATALLESLSEGAAAAAPAAAGVFRETGSFTSLIASAANPDIMGLNFASGGPRLHLQPVHQPKAALSYPRTGLEEDEIRMPGMPMTDGYMDQIAHMDVLLPPTHGRSAAVQPLATLDWPGGVDTPGGLFDAGAVAFAGDHGGYWNQSQWGEIDPSLFLP